MKCPECFKKRNKDVNLDVNEKEHQFCPECGWENPDVVVGLWFQRMRGFAQAKLLTEKQLRELLLMFKASYPDVVLGWFNESVVMAGGAAKVRLSWK